jgi:hypothetical protein
MAQNRLWAKVEIRLISNEEQNRDANRFAIDGKIDKHSKKHTAFLVFDLKQVTGCISWPKQQFD